MPDSQAVFATVPVALLYQGDNLGGHLKDALRDLGADIVYESLASDLDRDALEGCGARIVVFNLDSESDAQIDYVYDVLDEGDYEVVFNDGNASAQLAGTDQARWARHLAAKILNKPEIAVPARPVWAESVPMRAKKPAATVAPATVTPIARQPIEAASAPAPTIAAAVAFEEPAAIDHVPAIPASEAPTLELPVLDTVGIVELEPATVEHAPEPSGAEHADAGQADAEQEFSAALEDFARQVPAHTYAAPAADDFASQIDALFADTRVHPERAKFRTPPQPTRSPALNRCWAKRRRQPTRMPALIFPQRSTISTPTLRQFQRPSTAASSPDACRPLKKQRPRVRRVRYYRRTGHSNR